MRTALGTLVTALGSTIAALASNLVLGVPALLLVGIAGENGIPLVLAVAGMLSLWVSIVWGMLRGFDRLTGRRMTRAGTLVAAVSGIAGLGLGSLTRRAAFGRPGDADYSMGGYAALYTVALAVAVVGAHLARAASVQPETQ
jgi:hypothetical protein